MGLLTLEGVVENGQIRLCGEVTLPERATVYVVVPDAVAAVPLSRQPARASSPRLARPGQATDFAKQVTEVSADAGQP